MSVDRCLSIQSVDFCALNEHLPKMAAKRNNVAAKSKEGAAKRERQVCASNFRRWEFREAWENCFFRDNRIFENFKEKLSKRTKQPKISRKNYNRDYRFHTEKVSIRASCNGEIILIEWADVRAWLPTWYRPADRVSPGCACTATILMPGSWAFLLHGGQACLS